MLKFWCGPRAFQIRSKQSDLPKQQSLKKSSGKSRLCDGSEGLSGKLLPSGIPFYPQLSVTGYSDFQIFFSFALVQSSENLPLHDHPKGNDRKTQSVSQCQEPASKQPLIHWGHDRHVVSLV